jgi:hypothetical protein
VSLRDDAAAFCREILEDVDGGFAMAITVRDPLGQEAEVTGISADIGSVIDLNTGQLVSGRAAHVTVSLQTLRDAGIAGIPQGEADSMRAPWLFLLLDIMGGQHVFKVKQAMPDLTLGVVRCSLEIFRGG